MTAFNTNVLLYSCDHSDPARQTNALDLIESVQDGVMPWQVACEFVAASRKLAKYGFTQEDAWSRLPPLMARVNFMHVKGGPFGMP